MQEIEKKINEKEKELDTLDLFCDEFSEIRKEKIKMELDHLYNLQIQKMIA